jgi:hypothetical protein
MDCIRAEPPGCRSSRRRKHDQSDRQCGTQNRPAILHPPFETASSTQRFRTAEPVLAGPVLPQISRLPSENCRCDQREPAEDGMRGIHCCALQTCSSVRAGYERRIGERRKSPPAEAGFSDDGSWHLDIRDGRPARKHRSSFIHNRHPDCSSSSRECDHNLAGYVAGCVP